MSILLITHDLGVVSEMAHRVAVMYAGEIVEIAPREAFFARPAHPYSQKLFEAVPDAAGRDRRAGGHSRARAAAVAGVRRLPLCRSLRIRLGALPRGSPGADRDRGRAQRALPPVRRQEPNVEAARRKADGVPRQVMRDCLANRPPSLLYGRGPEGLLPDPQGHPPARGRPREGGRRRVARHSLAPHAGAGGRIGLRQDHGRQRHPAARSGHRRAASSFDGVRSERAHARASCARGARISRSSSRIRTARSIRACACWRSSRRAWPRLAWAAPSRRAQKRVDELLEQVGLLAGDEVPLSARILRRPAPAHRHRARAGGRAEADHLRRADQRARRVGAGADPEPAEGPADSAWGLPTCSSRTTSRWSSSSRTKWR